MCGDIFEAMRLDLKKNNNNKNSREFTYIEVAYILRTTCVCVCVFALLYLPCCSSVVAAAAIIRSQYQPIRDQQEVQQQEHFYKMAHT